jgi:hypothetical protein
MHNFYRCLAALKPGGYLAMLFLTFVPPTGSFTLARGGTTTSANPLVVGFWDVAEVS